MDYANLLLEHDRLLVENESLSKQVAEYKAALLKIADNKVMVEQDGTEYHQGYADRKISQFAAKERKRIAAMEKNDG